MVSKNNISIRKAKVQDVTEILKLIKELAEYEDLLGEVVANEELLKKTLFGTQSPAEVILAFDKEKVLGFALYFISFSTFLGRSGIYLEDLFVREGARGKGIGKALLCSMAKRAKEIGGDSRLEWTVLNWNKNAIDFYKKTQVLGDVVTL